MSNQNPQDPQQPHPYGAPAYGGYQPVPDHPQATTVLVLGIVGVFFSVVSPVAWYLGSKAKKEIEASQGRIGGLQQVTIGWILGIIFTILLVVGLVIFFLVLVLAVGILSTAP